MEKEFNYKDELNKECELAKKSLKREFCLYQIRGNSKVTKEIHKQIDRISSCDVNVLIDGASGTGKELAARAIHYLSSRTGKPFIPVNCGAIPESVFENELFGHVKGAFTDARFHQSGLVREAEGGSLFLDEIGTISPYLQVKLLRLLQDKEYKPLGESKSRKADIRIIAATNNDLSNLVKDGSFREDLFFRLNVVQIHIPPLDERKEDIPVLVNYYVRKFSKEYKKPIKEIPKELMDKFISYSWPGNIRELENKIQQLIVMPTSSSINADDIVLSKSKSVTKKPEIEYFKSAKKEAIDNFEKSYLVRLLTENSGNIVHASEQSGMSRTSLWNLLKKHKIAPKQFVETL